MAAETSYYTEKDITGTDITGTGITGTGITGTNITGVAGASGIAGVDIHRMISPEKD